MGPAWGVTLAHLAQQSKLVGVLNVADWFTPLLTLLSRMQQTGFVPIDLAERYLIVDHDPLRLLHCLLSYPRWPGAGPVLPSLDDRQEQWVSAAGGPSAAGRHPFT